MKKLTILLMLIIFGAHVSIAQKPSDDSEEVTKSRRERIKETSLERPSNPATNSLTAAEVGEPDSFGKNAKFLGIASSGYAIIYSSCDPAILQTDLGVVLGPDDRCLAVPNPNVTATAVFTDMARITFPARTASDIIYMINNHSINWDSTNDTAANLFGTMSYAPRVTIESVALNDPAAVDPNTGLPLNGSFTTTGNGTKFSSGLLAPGAINSYVESYSRANTLGFSREYFRALGFPNSVINSLYRNPMTIRLGMRLSVRGVPYGQYVYTARFLGN
ncbi:MAG: hypothetical protein IPK58_04915 [Acidobacteria bacterium]|nr:hypothetical protein [Acidobacteriota bacterium]